MGLDIESDPWRSRGCLKRLTAGKYGAAPFSCVKLLSGAFRLFHNYLHMIAMSFVYWDHFVTLDTEIEYLWKQPQTPSARLFFLNRYLSFFGNICVTVLAFTTLSVTVRNPSPVIQSTANKFTELPTLQSGPPSAINYQSSYFLLTMRIYAIYACSLRILFYMVASAIILTGVSCWSLSGQKHVNFKPLSGCHIGLDRDTAIRIAAAWEALFIYDTILFSLTLFKTYKERRNHITPDILSLILRDGGIYFAVMALANLSNILTFYLAPVNNTFLEHNPSYPLLVPWQPFLRGSLSSFASCISVTMMSRLMLNLHQTATIGIFSAGFPTNDLTFRTVETATVQFDDDTELQDFPSESSYRPMDCI
ncbi:uncharacterized protein BT62DRAFT_1003114 [Guyanagaster necrorhizus]|uniref:DUF6533 domain-containing protein n=1 Tax=Guyanagaster necrorhizus TaxID=856835 RepID=A0A9P7VWW0_9AGAR|nr:uncharacterized protein BT62DRAFT_1003114 [Guyanagaster necrorhizus MCA 3950]KAG7448397.1 hypothetical protein BT62DRAFT_1003114 [Guyanagaster necrorhizus MCA 3950]